MNTLKGNPLEWNRNCVFQFLVKILNVSKSVSSIFDDDTLHKTSLWKCLARNYILTLVNIPTRYDDQRWILWKNCNLGIYLVQFSWFQANLNYVSELPVAGAH